DRLVVMPDATAPERLRGADTTAAPRSTTARARLGEFGVLLGGRATATGTTFDVRSPYDGELVATVHRAGPSEVEQAIARTTAAFAVTRRLPTWKRAHALEG